MKRFEWRLQKVLDVKTGQEQLRRNELFQITEQLAARRGALLLRQRILQDLMTEIKAQEGPGRWSAQEFVLRHASADEEQMRRLREEIATLTLRQKEKTAELLTLRRFKEGLEKLREQAKEQYIREQERVEQKESDERTAIAFVRNEGNPEDREPKTENGRRAACAVLRPRSAVLRNQEPNR
jgi:hypothetical protein